jgi:hypothetical protein
MGELSLEVEREGGREKGRERREGRGWQLPARNSSPIPQELGPKNLSAPPLPPRTETSRLHSTQHSSTLLNSIRGANLHCSAEDFGSIM